MDKDSTEARLVAESGRKLLSEFLLIAVGGSSILGRPKAAAMSLLM